MHYVICGHLKNFLEYRIAYKMKYSNRILDSIVLRNYLLLFLNDLNKVECLNFSNYIK